MKLHFFGADSGKPRISEHLLIYILSLLDPESQSKASQVNKEWGRLVKLTQTYMALLPTIQRIPLFSKVGLDTLRLKPITGGMTNTTYKVKVGSNPVKVMKEIPGMSPAAIERHKRKQWVLRIPGEVSLFSVFRKHEAHNARQAEALGLNVPIEYFDPDGLQLTKFIEGVQPLDKATLQRTDVLQTLARMTKRLHTSKLFLNDTHVFDNNEKMLTALKTQKFSFPADISVIEKMMSLLESLFSSYNIEMSPCHNDPTPLNYMLSLTGKDKEEEFHQIDWEYSSNNDIFWDLAYFAIEAKLTKEQELIYLTAYFGEGHVTESVLAWFMVYKPLVEWWITLWSWTQLANGANSVDLKSYESLGFERYHKTMSYLQSDDCKEALAVIDADRSVVSFSGQRLF